MSHWLHVVGVGDDGLDGLAPAARRLVDTAEVIVGAERHLAMLGTDTRRRIAWPKPFDPLIATLEDLAGKAVCVLASGDPSWYGVGSLLAEKLGTDAVRILPSPSAFSLACARLGWRLARVECLSLHGRPLELLHPFVLPGNRLLVLSEDATTPGQVAACLRERGYGPSRMTVLSHLGGPRETRVEAQAAAWEDQTDILDLNLIAIECRAGPGSVLQARTPGLPDDLFEHDGQLTKREMRAVTLANLAPVAGQLLWDVGAGCGSIAIEWMRAERRCRAVAIERDRRRADFVTRNALALGTPTLSVVHASAPQAFESLPRPDAVFVGGGATVAGLLDTCWSALKPGGRLVANVVSLEGEQALGDWQLAHGGALIRVGVSRAETLGRFRGWRPFMPVTQLAATKS